MTNAETKIQMLKGSMRCFACGLVSLIPLFGFPFAIAALWISGRVRVAERNFWNAARPYRVWGGICAALSMGFWSFVLILIIARALNVI
jgi:hypothetical protein